MVMKTLRDGASGGITKFFLLGFMALAVGGLVMTDVGGFFRGGVGSSDAAKVGGEPISIIRFDRKARQAAQQLGISTSDAYKFGYINQLLNVEIRNKLLQQAAENLGLRVGESQIASRIRQIIDPLAQQQERDPKDILKQVLLNQGLSEGEFVHTIGSEMSTGLLRAALQSGFVVENPYLVQDVHRYRGETRNVEAVLFLDKDVKNVPAPSEEQLLQLYEATKESYSIEETREFQILEINDERLRKTLEVSEEDIRQTYENSQDLYTLPARYVLQQSLLDTQEQADAVREKVQSGSSLQNAIKALTQKTTGYLGEKEFEANQLMDVLKEPVTGAEKPGSVLDPVQSPLGWYVVVVKDIKEAGLVPFNDVRADIKKEIEETQLIDQVYALANDVDDMLAGGATVEDVREQVELKVTDLPALNQFGQTLNKEDGLKAFEQARTSILESGFGLLEGETSPVVETPGGRFIAVHVKAVQEKTYQDFDKVKDQIEDKWISDQRSFENKLRLQTLLEDMTENNQSLGNIAKAQSKNIQRYTNLKRSDMPKGGLLPQSVYNLFETSQDQPVLIDIEGGSALAVVKDITLPAPVETNSKDFGEVETSLLQNSQQDSFMLYVNDKAQETSVAVNDGLLQRIYGGQQ